ncbi:MAG: glycerol-3-phosphate dehydrogenase/oxidase [Acidimicrobiales bacterium]
MLDRLGDRRRFDVLVIGGGVTGAGVAVDAAARGLRTALVERRDFASGTSSRSSKLVHGGLRYLRQGELGLVRENLMERKRLLQNAPHLVSPLPFLIPLLRSGTVQDKTRPLSYSVALWLYDLAAGTTGVGRHHRVGREAGMAMMKVLDPDRLVDAFVYNDAHADDARLTLALARTAADLGATVLNYAEVAALAEDRPGNCQVATVIPAGPGEGESRAFEVQATVVVNAAGVWAEQVLSRRSPAAGAPASERLRRPLITPAKGVHVVLPRSAAPTEVAGVLPVPGGNRTVFLVPWGDHVYLGTTDTAYEGPLDDPSCGPEDVAYLLGTLSSATTAQVAAGEVTGVWAGLRPLLSPAGGRHGGALAARTADLSRRHSVLVDGDGGTGTVTVIGGKLTTYRKMAEDAVSAAARLAGWGIGPSPTRSLPLHGAVPTGAGGAGPGSVGAPLRDRLSRRYGSDAAAVANLAAEGPELGEALVPGLPYTRAEAVYAVQDEMALTIDDVMSRRTRAALLDAARCAAAAGDVASLLGRYLPHLPGVEPGGADQTAPGWATSLLHDLAHARGASGVPLPGLPSSGPAPASTGGPGPASTGGPGPARR